MNELSTIVDGERMTSLQIAEITGKPHADVMKAIRKMEPAWSKINEGNFPWLNTKTRRVKQDLATLSTKKNVSTSPPSSTMKREPS